MNAFLARAGNYYSQLAVFLFCALALIVPSGYSVGSALLLGGGLLCLLCRPSLVRQLQRDDCWLIAIFLFYGLMGIINVLYHGESSRYFDKPVRFLLAPVGLFLLMRFKPRIEAWWAGVAVGGMTSGLWAIEQKFYMHIDRATGHTNAIQYGNLSMLLGLWCLAGLMWAHHRARHRLPWVFFLAAGALLGVTASLLSGSRGGWVGLPLVLLVFYRAYSDIIHKKIQLLIALILIGGAAAIYLTPNLGVQARIHEAYSDIHAYWVQDKPETSIGQRFEMWKAAGHLIQERPIMGWGNSGYHQGIKKLLAEKRAHPAIEHYTQPHNELLNYAAKYGIPGILALFFIYALPFKLFSSGLHHPCQSQRATAVAGTLLAVSFIDFGLTQAFLSHNSGTMVYAFGTVFIWGLYRHQKHLI